MQYLLQYYRHEEENPHRLLRLPRSRTGNHRVPSPRSPASLRTKTKTKQNKSRLLPYGNRSTTLHKEKFENKNEKTVNQSQSLPCGNTPEKQCNQHSPQGEINSRIRRASK